MLRSSLILAALLPLMLCGEADAAGKGADGPVTYAAYHAEWGGNLTPPTARSIHLELTRDKLRASLTGNMPSLIYAGSVDGRTFDEIAGLLRAMDAASWPGATGEADRSERRKDCCEWSVRVTAGAPGGRQVRVYGADKGRDTARLEAEARLCGYLKEKLPELHASMPKRLERLSFSDRPAGIRRSVIAEEGRVRVCVIAKGQPVAEFFAAPELLWDLRSLMDRSGADAWHGFGYGRYEPGRMPLCLEAAYSTGQPVVVLAEPGRMPKGFAELCAALRARLGPLARRWQATGAVPAGGIKRFHFGENGMRMAPHYVVYRRLDAEGARAHVMRVWGGAPDGDAPLSEAEELELAGILRGLAAWDGFDGTARGVLDAPGFSFHVEFGDGRRISASGYGMSPKGYRAGRDSFLDFIEKRLPKSARDR